MLHVSRRDSLKKDVVPTKRAHAAAKTKTDVVPKEAVAINRPDADGPDGVDYVDRGASVEEASEPGAKGCASARPPPTRRTIAGVVLGRRIHKTSTNSTEDEGGSTSRAKPKGKGRGKAATAKKKFRKERAKNEVSPAAGIALRGSGNFTTDSSSPEDCSKPKLKKEAVATATAVAKTTKTEVDSTKYVIPTTNTNKYTFMKLPKGEGEEEDCEMWEERRPPKPEKKSRTQSCSSIPYDDIIDNLAVFRKSFDNVHFLHDENLTLLPIQTKVSVAYVAGVKFVASSYPIPSYPGFKTELTHCNRIL